MQVQKAELMRFTTQRWFLAFSTIVAGGLFQASGVSAQGYSGQTGGLHEDPVTGDVYRTVTRKVVRPVVDERIERQEKTVFRPETVRETRPEFKTVYTPVTEMKWVPYVQDRWNPFRKAAVAYQQIPETRWQARSEVVERTTTETRWVPEKRTVEIPHRTVRYQTSEHQDYELVSRGASRSSIDPAIAARLRPMNGSTGGTAIAARPITPRNRSSSQSGMPTHVLSPAGISAPSTGSSVTTQPITIYR